MRNLTTPRIRRFKGLNCWETAVNVSPEWAIDIANVLVSGSGGLEKLRYPTDLSAVNSSLIGSGNIFNYQNALGVRQLLAVFDDRFYSYELSTYIETLRNSDPLNVGVISAVCSNNIAFIANGRRMMKWDGTNFWPWGIEKPQAPARNIVATAGLADPTVAPTLASFGSTYGKSARTYTVSYTWTMGSGETRESPPATINLTEYTWCRVELAAAPAGATGFNIYADPSGGASRHRVNTADHDGLPNPIPDFTPFFYYEWPPIGFYNHESDPAPPVGNTTGAGIELTIGRQYRVAFANSVTGHIGAASEPSPSTGAVTTAYDIQIIIANPTDAQCDKIYLFCTVDGGADYYLSPNPNSDDGSWAIEAGNTTTIIDRCLDDDLNKSIIAPLINNAPPVGKYVCEWGGRIYVFNLTGALQDIAFSGYERIYLGRPEESFPPNNRLRLALGADEIRGGGVIQAGVIAFSKSNEMFMLRGTVTDRSTDAPVEYLAELEKLPWNTGCASHFSIARTPYGLVWLASDKTIKIYNGVAEPITLAGGLLPVLRSITPGTEEDARGLFFCFLEREWYLLLCAVDGSENKNRILIVDLEPDQEKNVGGMVLYVAADAMELVEDADGTTHLVIVQDGILKELRIVSDTTSGISLEFTATENLMPAKWRSGYFGNDSPDMMKVFRYARLVTDQLGFQIQTYLVDDEQNTFRDPGIIPFSGLLNKLVVNRKARRASFEIKFPEDDTAANVLELSTAFIPTSER